jgi:hypothetical protein
VSRERYAVVSCHVERPLDDAVWGRFSSLQKTRPGGFRIAALMRPADGAFGEDENVWVARAREAAARGPLGHHTHWTAPDHARPVTRTPEALVTQCHNGTADRVLREARSFRQADLAPTLFCGGGWYTDSEVAEACAELGYVDCTPRATRPAYLPPEAPWATLERAGAVELSSGAELRAIPTTHSLGDLLRALPSRRLPELVHVYFHDTDLLDARRRALLRVALPLLARRAHATDLDELAGRVFPGAPGVPWDDVARN